MEENNPTKTNPEKSRNLLYYLLFSAIAIVFFVSGIILKINIVYTFAAVGLLVSWLFFCFRFLSILSLALFSCALWEVKTISLENIFLLSLGFIASYLYLLQFAVSRGKEANPLLSFGAGLLVAAPYIFFSALQYKAFASSLVISPLGIMLIVFIIIFLRLQCFIWKGK